MLEYVFGLLCFIKDALPLSLFSVSLLSVTGCIPDQTKSGPREDLRERGTPDKRISIRGRVDHKKVLELKDGERDGDLVIRADSSGAMGKESRKVGSTNLGGGGEGFLPSDHDSFLFPLPFRCLSWAADPAMLNWMDRRRWDL